MLYKVILVIIKNKTVKGVLLEKPAGISLKEIQKTLELLNESPICIQVNHIRRFPSVYQEIAQEIHQGKIGKTSTNFTCSRPMGKHV